MITKNSVNRADLRKAHRWPRCIVPAQRLEARAGEPRQVHPHFRPAGEQGDNNYWGRSKKSIHITDQPWQVAKAVCCWVGIGKPPICSPCTGSWQKVSCCWKKQETHILLYQSEAEASQTGGETESPFRLDSTLIWTRGLLALADRRGNCSPPTPSALLSSSSPTGTKQSSAATDKNLPAF